MRTTPIVRPRTGSRPASAAASATAPPGSTTRRRCRNARRIAAATSSSVTASPPASRRELMAKVSSPGIGASSASQRSLRARSVAETPARCKRAGGVVEAGGLDRMHGHARHQMRERDGAACDQATAAAAYRHRLQHGAAGRGLLGELQPDRALPGDDQGIVVGTDQHRPGACRRSRCRSPRGRRCDGRR